MVIIKETMLVINFSSKYMMLIGAKLVTETISVVIIVIIELDFKSKLRAIVVIVDRVIICKLARWFEIIKLSMDFDIDLALMDY